MCIGAWQLGGPVTFFGHADGHPDPGKALVVNMIAELRDHGINFIDTAEGYSDGESERRIGQAIAGQRDSWVISSKFGYRAGPNQTRDDSSAPATIRPSLEGSLKRLGTDYLDIYLYHCPPELEHLDEAKEILDAAKQRGEIRHYGISTNEVELVKELHRRNMLEVLQYDTSLINPSDELREFACENNIGTQLRGTMANGRLSGRYFKNQPVWGSDDNRSHWHNHRDFSVYAPLQELLPTGYTMSQCAIRLMLDLPGNHSICMGAKNMEDYKTAIAAISLPEIDPSAASEIRETALRLSALPGA